VSEAAGPRSRPRPVFVKLGGALLTEKDGRETLRPAVLADLAAQLGAFASAHAAPLVVAHGSGSYAHLAARELDFTTRPTPLGLARVSASARRLDSAVVDALVSAGLPAVPVPGAALAVCAGGAVLDVRHDLVTLLLDAGLVPVVYGDAVPDPSLGGTIASTEPILLALARHLAPLRVVLATDVDGVYRTDPHGDPSARPIPVLTRADLDGRVDLAGARAAVSDVTGGMGSKVRTMFDLVLAVPDVEVRIVSGLRAGAVRAALEGDPGAGGTVIRA
jgi:isopentenyl phosphate kinase